ncbi:MAG TPA: L-threonylcarbamoyladenylate synthase [Acidimicrobiia bacterium]|nr:L-threonylcarbamoyladenylate synthase [Acidimicrobiia bacterium]
MIQQAVEAVRDGELVGLPTDTVYGIGADPFSPEGVARLFELKGRPAYKPVGVLVAGMSQASEIAEISGAGLQLAQQHWPGALTLVVRPRVVMADWVGDQQLRTLGVRVPDHPMALELLTATGPLAVTSANESGGRETRSDSEARAIFGDRIRIYVPGVATGGEASTVVDATGTELAVLRDGPVRV